MINLIPPEGKRMLRREYLVRVGSVFATILALAVAAGALMLLPTYVLLTHPQLDAESHVVSDEAHKLASDELAAAQKAADRLKDAPDSVAASDVLVHIEQALDSAITLRAVRISPEGDNSKIQVVGVATTRDALQSFIGRLKADTFFLDASVPVTDLARNIDAAFTLTVTLRPQAQ